jgi:hypothetical protein
MKALVGFFALYMDVKLHFMSPDVLGNALASYCITDSED